MAAILATVDIEDLATAKVKGIKDALTDLVQTQQTLAASSGALATGTQGVIAAMGSQAVSTAAAATSFQTYVTRVMSTLPVLSQVSGGMVDLALHIKNQQLALQGAAQLLTLYAGSLAGVAQAARDGTAPLALQAAALADVLEAAQNGVTGLKEHEAALAGMMMQLSQNIPLTKEQAAALDEMAASLVAANRETLSEASALQTLAAQAQASTATIRENYQSLTLLTSQLTEGVTVTKLQADALAELAAAAQAGNGFTKEQAAALAELSAALQAGVTLTAEQAAELQRLTAEYQKANAETLGYKEATEQATTAVEALLAAHREEIQGIRQTYEALQVLSTQLEAGTQFTKEQAAALQELSNSVRAAGMTEYANALQGVATAAEKGEVATEQQTDAVKQATTAYGEAQKEALGLKDISQESIGVFNNVKAAALALSAVFLALGSSLLHYAEAAVQAAARGQVLSVVLGVVGKNANQNNADLLVTVERIKQLGITTDNAIESVVKFTQAELKQADAAKLARVAQDLAVVGNTNSSQAFETLTRAIESQSTRMLRQFGIVMNLSKVYNEYAKEVGTTVAKLDEIDKKQALLNSILKEGEKFAGTYEAAMDKVGKQYTSLSRLADEMLATIGSGLLPIFEKWVRVLTEFYGLFLKLPEPVQRLTSALITFVGALASLGGVLAGAKLLGVLDLFSKAVPAARAAGAAFTTARAGAAILNPALAELAVTAGKTAGGLGVLRAAGVALSAFFGGPYVATFAVIATIIAAATAAYTFFNSSQEKTTQKASEHVAETQAQIDKIREATDTIDKYTTTVKGHTVVVTESAEQVDEYNAAVKKLNELVPGAVTGVDQLTGAFNIQQSAIDTTVGHLKDYMETLRKSAAATIGLTQKEAKDAGDRVTAAKAAVDAAEARLEDIRKRNQAQTVYQGPTAPPLQVSVEKQVEAQQALIRSLTDTYTARVKEKAGADLREKAAQALIDGYDRETDANTKWKAALEDARRALYSAAGGVTEFKNKIKAAGLQKELKEFESGFKKIKVWDADLGKNVEEVVLQTADDVRKAGLALEKGLDEFDKKQEAEKKRREAEVKAAIQQTTKAGTITDAELAQFKTLNTMLQEAGVGTAKWRQLLSDTQPIIQKFGNSVLVGSKELGSLNEAFEQTNKFSGELVPQQTINDFKELEAALLRNAGNAEEYVATLKRGAPLLEQWRAMTAGQRQQLGPLTEVYIAATTELERFTAQLEKQAKLETTEQLGQARLEMMDRQHEMLRDLTREEEDAARRRRDANISADEAIYQSRVQMEDTLAQEKLKGDELLKYQTMRQVEALQHRYETEKAQRDLALQDEEKAVELRIQLAEDEIARRAELAIRARDFEIKMMQAKADAAAAFAAERPGDIEAQKEAERLSAQAEVAKRYFDAYRDGIIEIRDEELRLQQTTNKRLRDTVAANKKAADEISAGQKALVDEQIKQILKLADAHTMVAEIVKEVWKSVAGAFSAGLLDMLKDGKTFTQGMEGLWKNNLEPALKGVWERIRDSVFGIMEEMLAGWLNNLLKMKAGTKAADIFGSITGGGAKGAVPGGTGVWMSGQGSAAGGGVSPYAFGGKIQGGSIGRMGSMRAGAAGGVMGGVIGAQIGYGVGGATGSYSKGILSGAGSGAAAGAAFGAVGGPIGAGIGALIGGVIGGVGGWFGAKKAHAEARKARDEYISGWKGGMEELKKKALDAGTSLDAFNKAKTPEQVKKAIEDLEKAFKKLDDAMAAKKGRDEYIKSFERGITTLKERAELAGVSLEKLFDAKTPEDLAKAIDEINEALLELEKREILAKAKKDLATTYAQMLALSKQAQLVGFDLDKLYNADTIEEFNRQQERLNQLLAEQQERLQALSSASEGLETWATGFSQTLQKGFEGAFPKAAEVEDFYKKFKEAQDRGFKGSALDFSKQMRRALPMEEFVKIYQEYTDKGFKGTYEELARHLQMPASFIESLKKTAAASQSEFQALGITAAATFAAIVRETGDIVQAMNQIAPTLDQLIDAQDKWGLKADESFSSLIQFRRIIKDNQDVFNSISGLTQALKGLTDANALTEESFDAMGRTAVEKYNVLKQRTGDAKLSLLSMQPTLQALWEAQKKFGFTVDESTQALINQGIEQGMVGANMQSIDQKMLDVLGLIAQALGVAKDKLTDLGLAGATAGGAVTDGVAGATATAAELEAQLEETRRQAALLDSAAGGAGGATATAGDDAVDAMAAAAARTQAATKAMADLAAQGTIAGDAIKAGTDLALGGLDSIITRAGVAQLALFAMGVEGERAGRKIEWAAHGAAEGHSPTGIKQIIVRTEEAHAALGVYSQDFLRAAQQMEEAAAGVAAVEMVPQDKFGELTGTLGGLNETFPLDKFEQLLRDLQTLEAPDKTVFVEPPTTIPEGAVTVQITQEGATISVNALDNANMDEAWRNLIMPAYVKHLDNNADQLAERTESAIIRYRRRVG